MKKTFKDISQQRTYITNFVNRKFIGEKFCANCTSIDDLSIVHNRKNPYLISFICKGCRSKLSKEQRANLPKINILENIEVNKRYSRIEDLELNDKMKFIIENSLKTNLSLTDYLKSHNVSYYKFKIAVKLYNKNVSPIEKDIKNHFKELRAKNIIKSKHENDF